MKYFNIDEALKESTEYFKNDELAGSVFVEKYLLKDNEDRLLEKTPTDMHWRMAKEFARIEKNKFKTPMTEEFIFSLFDHFKYIVPQGSPMFGIGNNFQKVSLSNCFLVDPPEDSYADILRVDEQIVQISKRRGGAGIDISKLRPEGTRTQNAGRTSSGIIPFMKRFSNSISEVAQNGRRGALGITISVHHPQILDFIHAKDIKIDEKGNKTQEITGANISVRLSDEFLEAVEKDNDYELRWPVDAKNPKISKMISAKKVWNEIIQQAHAFAEPGLLMWDTVLKETPSSVYEHFKPVGTNPCVTGDSLITTEIGDIAIKDLIKLDNPPRILSYDEKTGETVYDEFIQGCKTRENANVIKIELENGNFLVLTPDHQVFTENRGWIKASQLTKEDILLEIEKNKVNFKQITVEKNQDVYDITVKKNHNFFANGILIHNCAEILLSPLDSCRLLLLNLYSYVQNPFTKDAKFDFELFSQHSKIAQRLMDDLVDLEAEKIQKIIDKIKTDPESDIIKCRELDMWERILQNNNNGRRTGTGTTAFGDTMAALGIKYASDECHKKANKIYKQFKLACYRSSVDMAKELGHFKDYDAEKEKNHPFIMRIKDEDPDLYADMKKYGRRNIALTTMAPAGSVSIETQTTSGIEPLFTKSYTRRKKINDNEKNLKVDSIDAQGIKWHHYNVNHPKVDEWMRITGLTDFTKSPWYGCCASDINWEQKIRLQAIIQKNICHSLSNTCNIPATATIKDVAKIYETAWKSGCKGATIYRQGSRDGVLIETEKPLETDTIKDIAKEEVQEEIPNIKAPKRPKELPCDIYHIKITKKLDKIRTFDYMVLVGLYNKIQPYEVFAVENGKYDKKITKGKIIKETKGRYHLIMSDGTEIKNITKDTSEYEDSTTRFASTALRHGIDITTISEQLAKIANNDDNIYGFCKSIARALKHYIKEGAISDDTCVKCGMKLVFEGGCFICKSCSYSKCN